jgi:hypothetical protein
MPGEVDTPSCVLDTLSCVLDTPSCVLDTLSCVLDTPSCVLDTLSCVLDTPSCVLDALSCVLDTLSCAISLPYTPDAPHAAPPRHPPGPWPLTGAPRSNGSWPR